MFLFECVAVSAGSAAADTWIQGVAQTVAQIVHRQHGQRDQDTGPQHTLGEERHPVNRVIQQATPGGEVRREAKAKEGQADSVMIAVAMPRVAETMIGDSTLGRM